MTSADHTNPATSSASGSEKSADVAAKERLVRSDEEWRRLLTPEQYRILRQAGTERAFTGAYWDTKEAGLYSCAGCGQELFVSDTKFDSGCGWPAFFEKIEGANIVEKPDHSHGMVRTEVVCGRCDGHLGHIFPDGPPPTGMRYCINSAAMTFEPANAD
ncbi:MAG: peptide-methionine (R)-S-oxide reductase [Phycisphaeraceae bacterium]|nr:MAG: peptide-methionine (R)-S-oxide reductase [Phycisphaeraceae bacterium]